MSGLVARGLTGGIRLYRSAISPLRPPVCRYRPTCSEYAVDALEIHGAGRGTWLAIRRLLRCHPFHAGGHDPVPPRVSRPTAVAADLPSVTSPSMSASSPSCASSPSESFPVSPSASRSAA